MELIAKGLAAGLLVWFFLLAALIGVRILRGEIHVTGLMANSQAGAGNGNCSPPYCGAHPSFFAV
jgi:hypothetical protein